MKKNNDSVEGPDGLACTARLPLSSVTVGRTGGVRVFGSETRRDAGLIRRARSLPGNGLRRVSDWRRWRCSRQGTGAKHADKQMAARQSWDALKLDLCTTVDSGYRLFGLPLLTKGEVDELEREVLVEIKAADPTATASVRKNLHAILKACAGRIDVLA
ncbi:hypothetical protein ACFWWB_37855 [Streptomyces sp. NPDC058690]|uniref:hypothetical protein n=1 Tax=Streptomyces sp. NPDC058690 TaxID=3346600 RepID=UPI003664D8C5